MTGEFPKFQKFPNDTVRLSNTSSSYETAKTFYEGGGAVVLIFNNTSTELSYKINLYLTDSTNAYAYPAKTATTIAASTHALDTNINVPFYKADILVATTATASTNSYHYQIDRLRYL